MNIRIFRSKKISGITLKYSVMAIFAFFCISLCSAQDNSRNIIARSNFIFSGTILKMNASNIEVSTTSPVAIVRVDEVIDAVPPYDLMEGKEITVLLASVQHKKAGDKQVFYTMGWYYGKTLGVKEIPNNLPVPEKLVPLKARITNERVNIRNDSLREELKKAVLVVHAVVVETDINVEHSLSLESEHDPEIKKAIIDIKSVLKGKISKNRVEIYYSSSDDVMWYSSPKPKKGEEAIFLLHVRQAPAIFKIQGYTLLDRRDLQPAENQSEIQRLLKY